jgi:peptide/nickel transport system permease protein
MIVRRRRETVAISSLKARLLRAPAARRRGDETVEVALRGRHPLIAYTIRRVAVGVLLVFLASVFIFAATQALGNPAAAILGAHVSPLARQQLDRQLGLDHPVVQQYWHWLSQFVQGNLGRSLVSGQPVGQYLAPRVANTLTLAGVALAVIVPVALFLGTWSALRRDGVVDHIVSALSLGAIAVPEFVTGTLLVVVFAVTLRILPAVSLVGPGQNPLGTPKILVLPVATLALAALAYLIRMVRAGVIEVMESEYAQMARLNGVPERRVVWRHVLRNALAPTVQVLAQTVQWLIGGVVVTETVFAYPGFGSAFLGAVSQRDITVVQAGGLLVAVFYIAINIVADVTVVLLIPKLRTTR